MRSAWLLIILLGLGGMVEAAPLTLADALAAADQAHPDVAMAEADVASAKADVTAAGARQDLTVTVEGVLRQGRPTAGSPDWRADNSGRVVARKNLYDFSRTSSTVDAAEAELAAREQALISSRDQHRLEVMARYFDVLIADQQYAADNEFMAVVYVSFDNARDRMELGQLSRPDLAVLEAKYQDIREKRNASLARQRLARSALANAMYRPGELASDLVDPALAENDLKLPDYETLLPVVLAHNPTWLAQQQLLTASQKRLDSLRHENSPTLDAEVEAGQYSRDALTRNSVSGGLIMTWPIYQGRRVDARIAREQAQFAKLQATTEGLKLSLSQALLQTMLEIDQLRNSARPAAKQQITYRDIALDRSRAEYELELKTNLGDSMAQTMTAQQRARGVEYRLALAIARLAALTGEPANALSQLTAAKQ
ncbi:TolC family protein [Sulfuriferula thiophila]|uniref:TolC family protein n=1 Tax=Sulfuriferula thiophila TaxID=1781211 RepID=UPI000F6059C8|nr:TolC family protein [Sulfuriferula thiophila]